MSFLPQYANQLALQWETTDAGYTLVNSTGTILSWTAPNDGNLHTVHLVSALHVTSPQTGGQITMDTMLPDGTAVNPTAYAGGAGTGAAQFATDRIVEPGSTTSLVQSTALSVGAAVLWAQLWAA